jgi:hypothetical protein
MAYNRIRHIVSNNSLLHDQTALVLPPLNELRLNRWYADSSRTNERLVILSGKTFVPPGATAARPLLPASTRPTAVQKPNDPLIVMQPDDQYKKAKVCI